MARRLTARQLEERISLSYARTCLMPNFSDCDACGGSGLVAVGVEEVAPCPLCAIETPSDTCEDFLPIMDDQDFMDDLLFDLGGES